jgi:hypothetical protein
MPTSAPSTSNYTLGKGVLSIAEYGTSVFTDLGNCPSFELEPTEELLDHFSSRSGTRSKDKTVTLEKAYTLTFNLDELSVENMSLFMKATHTGNAEIQGLMGSDDAEHIIRFVSANGSGPDYTYTFHKVRLSPAGSMNLISDEWSEMAFSAEGLEDITNPSSPWFTITADATTTTTSSSSTTTTTS